MATEPQGWTLARRLRVGLALFALLLVLGGLAILATLRDADQALHDETQRLYPARRAEIQLLTSLVDQETGLRGYALTRDRRFLAPYEQGRVDEQRLRTELDRYIRPADPARLSLLSVDAATTAWREQYAGLRTGAGDSARTDSTIEFGRVLFLRVRETHAELNRQLQAEVDTAERRADKARRLVKLVLGAMAVALVLAVIGLQRALRRSVLTPLERLRRDVAEVSRGDHARPIRPVGPPDLREMGDGVESMRHELVRALGEVEAQQRSLERRAAELARSNADLEQFAYVASHDLQEPLRKVASFCQLLEQRYGEQLDERGKQYLDFAVDGAKRMQRLINDLLTFSRVGRTSEGFEAIDLAGAARRTWSLLDARVAASGATLSTEGLDVEVHGDATLVELLLSNLVGNALKYRHPSEPPAVRISAQREGAWVRVDVADNGIGIPEEYAAKVFVIFQRLHGRDEYDGTGIGLALCKKVVEFHGGTIGLRPSPLGGACLTFTLPAEEPHA